MLRTNNCTLVLAALLGTAVAPAFSETVFQLKNGDRVTGKVISEDTNQVVIATVWAKEMTLPLSQISKREEAPAPSVTATNVVPAATNASATVLTNAPVALSTNAPVAASGTNALPGKTLPPIGPVPVPIAPKPPKQWVFDIQLGASLQENQKSSENFNGLFKANYNSLLTRDTLEYHGAYGRTEGVVSANRMDANNRTEHDIDKSRRAYVFNTIGVGYDRVRKIDLTADDSVGIGYKFVQKPKFVFSGDFGVNYQEQYLTDEPAKDYFSLRVGEIATWAITPRVSFDEKGEFYPHMTSLGAYRLRLEGNLNFKLNDPGTLYLALSMVDSYDTKPAQSVTRNDLQLSARIGLKF